MYNIYIYIHIIQNIYSKLDGFPINLFQNESTTYMTHLHKSKILSPLSPPWYKKKPST